MHRARVILVSLALAAVAAMPVRAQVPSEDAAQVLLRSAWLWQVKERADLARAALEKLQNVSPDHARGLLELGLLDLKSGQADRAALLLQRLKAAHPGSVEEQRLAEAMRLATKDRFQLLAVRRLDESGDSAGAMAGLKKLFPKGPPDGELGIQYWQIAAGGPNGFARARKGLEGLVKDNAGDPRYPLALAAHLLTKPATRAQGFKLYTDTSQQYDLRLASALVPWKEGLRALPNNSASNALYLDYLAAVPDDPEIKGLYERANDPAVLALERGLKAIDRGQLVSAEEAMGVAYSKRPEDPEVLRGLALLRARQGRKADATGLYDRARSRETAPRQRVRTALDMADASLAAGRYAAARSQLETALVLDPANPWARLDLARLYARIGSPNEGRALMAEGVKGKSPDPAALHAQAIYLEGLDDEAAAIRSIERVAPKERTRAMNELAARARAQLRRREILTAAAGGNAAELEALLMKAETQAGTNPARLAEVASLWMDLGYPDRGVALLRSRVEAQPDPSAALLLAYAGVLDRARLDAELEPVLGQLEGKRDTLDSSQRVDLADVRKSWTLRKSEALAQAGYTDESVALLEAEEKRQSQDRELRLARAELLTDNGELAQARAVYDALRAEKPNDVDTQLSWARYLRKSRQRDAALAEYDAVLARAARGDVDTRESVVRGYLALDEVDRARAVTDGLRSTAPEDPSVLVHSGRVEAADGNYTEAIEFYRKAQAIEQRKAGGVAPGTVTAADDELARLQRRRRDGYVTAGIDVGSKSGDPGVSKLTDIEIPIEARMAVGYESSVFVRADPVFLDAGTLPADYDIAGLYGQVQANGPGALALFPQGRTHRERGLMAGIGFDNKHWRADIGTTPSGFPVHYLVGGLRYGFDAGAFGGAVEISRRPLTSSLVSFAGGVDPVSGETWGGVNATGASARLSWRTGDFSNFGSLGYYQLAGENVLDNDYLPLRLGTDWHLIEKRNKDLTVGVVGNYWRYSENQRYYTFGHGGYYSPQSYLGLAIPADFTGRYRRLAYRLRASAAWTHTREDDALFYPTRPDLQAAAAGQPLPANKGFNGPQYDGGPGGGFGWSAAGSLEYEVCPHLFIGGSGSIDRSEFYKPNFFSAWLRVPFNAWTGPVDYPPRPPTPYSRY